MAVQPTLRWVAGDGELDRRLIPLLKAVAASGSLNRAVTSLHLSYRHAWGMLAKTERSLARPLVVLERGRGARLTPFGEKLLAADAAAAEILNRELAATMRTLNSEAPAAPARAQSRPVVIHASHDLALGELRTLLLREPHGPAMDLQFRGSLECLADLARGQCDIAGFHVPGAPAGPDACGAYRPLLRARSLRLVRFVTRRQGLMVAKGNPRELRSLAQVADTGARFVNRQQGSGTRIYFDQLLAAAGIPPARINGYQNEEFTHAAVAATVASGMADAGFGIEAAARQHGLAFTPLATERYFLAVRAATLASPAVRALLETLKSPEFARCLKRLAGYDGTSIGDIVSLREALRPSQS